MESLLLDRLSTLSHPQRMAIFRLLIRRYPDALPVGEILDVLGLKPSTASVYLSNLKSAGLICQKRAGTHIFYSANIEASQDIVSGLFKDCCGNRADLCLPNAAKTANKPKVLFLCTGNSARSIMAEAILRDWPNAAFSVASAGTQPRSAVHPMALNMLALKGHETDGLHAKNTAEVLKSDFDFVLTVCDNAANQDHELFSGAPVSSHWGIPDPVNHEAKTSAPFERAYSVLNQRISRFVALPFEKANRTELQKMIDDIALIPAESS